MKKSLTLAAILVVSSAAGAIAAPYNNSGLFFKPYVGADYQFTHLLDDNAGGSTQANHFEQDLNGGNAHVGARLYKNFGIEAGYIENADAKSDGTKIQEHAPYADALFYAPTSDKFEWIGTVGISRYHAIADNSNSTKNSDYSTRGRYGVGAEYWLNDHMNIRTIARYEGEDFSGSNANNAAQFTAGLNIQY